MRRYSKGFIWTLCGLAAPFAFSLLLPGCEALNSALDSVDQATSPTTTDTPETQAYAVPIVSPDSATKQDQLRSGFEIRVDSLPVSDAGPTYKIKIQDPPIGVRTFATSAPFSSPDPVWNSFYQMVHRVSGDGPLARQDPNANVTNPYQPYIVTLTPTVLLVQGPIQFRVTLTNRTAHALSISIHPKSYVNGAFYDDSTLLHYGTETEIYKATIHSVSLAPGATESWTYGYIWLGNNPPVAGSILVNIPDIVVDPLSLKRESFQFAFDYRLNQRSTSAPTKSATIDLRQGAAQWLNGGTVEQTSSGQ